MTIDIGNYLYSCESTWSQCNEELTFDTLEKLRGKFSKPENKVPFASLTTIALSYSVEGTESPLKDACELEHAEDGKIYIIDMDIMFEPFYNGTDLQMVTERVQ